MMPATAVRGRFASPVSHIRNELYCLRASDSHQHSFEGINVLREREAVPDRLLVARDARGDRERQRADVVRKRRGSEVAHEIGMHDQRSDAEARGRENEERSFFSGISPSEL